MNIYDVLDKAIELGASDIHLTKDLAPVYRVNGELIEANSCFTKLDDGKLVSFAKEILSDKQYELLIDERNLDASISYGKQRLRLHLYIQMGSIAFAMRLIPMDIPNLKDLNLPKPINRLVDMKDGLILVVGPTGSGKSTTLAAVINEINKTKSKHIITVEDPIEYIHNHNKSVVNQREVGDDVHSFADAVKYAMREDPDILLLGELRDLETIQNAITMAETGHLVFGTLHTRSAAETPDRMIDVFPAGQQEQIRMQLANSLKAVVSQELLPRVGGGRVALCEIMFINDAIRNIIKKQGSINEIIDTMNATSKSIGSQTRVQSLANLYKAGLISQKVAIDGLSKTELSSLYRLISS